MFKKINLLVLIIFIAGNLFAKDIVLNISKNEYQGGEVEKSVVAVAISNKKVKMKMEGESNYFVFRGDKQLIWIVDMNDKQYIQIDKNTIENLKQSINPAIQKMRERIENLPEAQRQMAEKMMQQRMKEMGMKEAAKLTYEPTNQKKSINDYTCTKLEVYRNSEKIEDLWITKWDNIQYGEELKTSLNAISEFAKSLQDAFRDYPFIGFVQTPLSYDKDAELDGIPISAVHYENGEVVSTSVLEEIESKTLAEVIFLPPENYQMREPKVNTKE